MHTFNLLFQSLLPHSSGWSWPSAWGWLFGAVEIKRCWGWGGGHFLPLCVKGQGVAGFRDLGRGIVDPQKGRSGKPWATFCTIAWLHAQFLDPWELHPCGMQGLGATQLWPQAHSSELTHLLRKRFFFMSEFQLIKFYSSRNLVALLRSYKGLG